MTKRGTLFLFIIISLFTINMAASQPTGGNITLGFSERGVSSGSETAGIESGNLTAVNVTNIAITTRWAGFYGEVSGEIFLGDSSGNRFYEWTVSNVTGAVVFATNSTVSDWSNSNIVAANDSVLPSYLKTSATDNYNNTFNQSGTFTSLSITEANTNYTETFQNGTRGSLKTYALHSTADDALIFAGVAQDNAESFKTNDTTSTKVDYQLLLPAQSATVYNFYLELV